jgi:hypothetical protein
MPGPIGWCGLTPINCMGVSISTMAYDPILESWVIMSAMEPQEVDEDPEDTPIMVTDPTGEPD